ncbi:Transposase IS200 like protein [Janthinobacterium sp. KBS0711]|uniref:transposase n=1 Tax=Janthinobacterium sp. KBS0711 TaxID=1649647 RepID=UPI000627C2BF|nr:transposase [Janthinobacterium sp. KBS0711]KKO61281.1 Transposase IS200 like protein [Janthinobacterium sp. KBS0711]TSD73510.1 transposase [Janthinobacterium sp. KBS0711]
MPRRLRLALPGVPLHVVQRGVNRQACFLDGQDKQRYLDYLRSCLALAPCQLHAYVLMSNHVHLLLSTQGMASLASLMKMLNQRYVQYFNWRYGRTGSLWEGRYKSCLVQGERYLLICQRYIELNPVRAGIVALPGQYCWSSYRSNAQGVHDDLLSPHSLYLTLGRDESERQKKYQTLFQDELGERCIGQLREAVNAEFAVGDQAFLRQVAEMRR